MSFTVNFYRTSKKINSTKIPTTIIASATVELKDDCSILTPVLLIKNINMGVVNPNYCKIAEFSRYYYIKNITWNKGLWIAELSVDVLASYKSEIGAQTLYIERNNSLTNYDGDISDNMYPATALVSHQKIELDTFWNVDSLSYGMYVIGIAGQETTYYKMNPSALQPFLDYLFSELYTADLTDNWSILFPSLQYNANPLQFITSLMWFPFVASAGTSVNSIRVGWANVPTIYTEKIDGDSVVEITRNFSGGSLLSHPQDDRGFYLNNAPYTNYDLFYPPFGKIVLDPDFVINSGGINTKCLVDLRTGDATLFITASNTDYLHSWLNAKVGVSYQVSQAISRQVGVIDVMETALNVATSFDPVVAGMKGASALARDMANSKVPTLRSIGTNGSINSLHGKIQLLYTFKIIADEDIEHKGRPLCKLQQIDTLSGFIIVTDAHVEIVAEQDEIQEIITYLEGGFYYE